MTSRGAVNAFAGSVEPESIAEIVIEIQRLQQESPADPRVAGLMRKLMPLLRPTLRKVALRFGPTARGSLDHEDLVQVGFIEAMKFVPKYDHERRGSQTLEDHLYRRALSACEEHVRLHAHDVHLSDGASRGRTKDAASDVTVVRHEGAGDRHGGLGGNSIERQKLELVEESMATPEQMLEEAQMEALIRRCVNRLPSPLLDLVAWVHGVGRPKKSLREIAREWSAPRARLDADLKRGERLLRKMIERELNARHRR